MTSYAHQKRPPEQSVTTHIGPHEIPQPLDMLDAGMGLSAVREALESPDQTVPSILDAVNSVEQSGLEWWKETDKLAELDEPPVTEILNGSDTTQSQDDLKHQISLIIRGKASEQHHPGVMEQHADVILSDGTPMGFFGENGGVSAGIGMGMDGVVADPDWFEENRSGYMNARIAERYDMPSTVLTLNVMPEQAAKFDEYWANLDDEPGDFSLLGANCSTHAAEAFEYAGITDKGIPGLDTPDNLYSQLKDVQPAAMSESGYLGFNQSAAGDWSHHFRPLAADYEADSNTYASSNSSMSQSAFELTEYPVSTSGPSSAKIQSNNSSN